MGINNLGAVFRLGGTVFVENALVEDVVTSNGITGHILISYSVPNQSASPELLRLNINRNTIILNSNMRLFTIRKGMRINALFSQVMTRSIPPQANAYLIMVQEAAQAPSNVTTGRIFRVDTAENAIFTGPPNNINRQNKFIISDNTTITDRNGRLVNINALRPGQMVRIFHANFQTASIPPQTTAFHIQII